LFTSIQRYTRYFISMIANEIMLQSIKWVGQIKKKKYIDIGQKNWRRIWLSKCCRFSVAIENEPNKKGKPFNKRSYIVNSSMHTNSKYMHDKCKTCQLEGKNTRSQSPKKKINRIHDVIDRKCILITWCYRQKLHCGNLSRNINTRNQHCKHLFDARL